VSDQPGVVDHFSHCCTAVDATIHLFVLNCSSSNLFWQAVLCGVRGSSGRCCWFVWQPCSTADCYCRRSRQFHSVAVQLEAAADHCETVPCTDWPMMMMMMMMMMWQQQQQLAGHGYSHPTLTTAGRPRVQSPHTHHSWQATGTVTPHSPPASAFCWLRGWMCCQLM
jgi:hypothetical protein